MVLCESDLLLVLMLSFIIYYFLYYFLRWVLNFFFKILSVFCMVELTFLLFRVFFKEWIM